MTGHQSNDLHGLTSIWFVVPKEMERPKKWALDDADLARDADLRATASHRADGENGEKRSGWPYRNRDEKSESNAEATKA